MQALKALVIIMGIMIIVGVAVVVVTIYNRLGRMAEEPAPATSAPSAPSAPTTGPAGFGEAALPIPAGCRVASTAASGERLVLQLAPEAPGSGTCAQILVLDMGTGSLLGRFNVMPDGAPAQ